jgi:hypothetical protein
MVSKSSSEFLLQMRSSVASHDQYATSPATAPPNIGLDVGFCFREFIFFSNVFIVCLCDA